jgi:ketosteroid isomerase-like protein
MSSENVDLVRRMIGIFNAGERKLPAFWAEDAEVLPAAGFPEGGPYRGREQIQRFFDGLHEGWTGSTVAMGELREAGDKVLVSFEWRATGESSGLDTSSDWFAVYTFRGDQVVRLEFFEERASAMEAAGLK